MLMLLHSAIRNASCHSGLLCLAFHMFLGFVVASDEGHSLPSCEPYNISSADDSLKAAEQGRFLQVLRQAPREVFTLRMQEAVRRLLEQPGPSKGKKDAKSGAVLIQDAEEMAGLGDLVLGAYRQTGAPELLRTLITLRLAALEAAPSTVRMIGLADAYFDLCRHSTAAALQALSWLLAAEATGKMCNAKVHKSIWVYGWWLVRDGPNRISLSLYI